MARALRAAEPDDATPEPDRLDGCPHPRETRQLLGQEAAERGFLAAWEQDRMHHAWALTGPEGIGKATLAYRIARAVLAGGPGLTDAPATLDPPQGCPVLRRIRAGSEARLAVLRRTVQESGRLATQIRVEDIRKLRAGLALAVPDGGWRAVIVDAADEMNLAAQNALLKTLEEPPPRTLFLLVVHAPGRLLPTVRSRLRSLSLGALGPADLAAAVRAASGGTAGGGAGGAEAAPPAAPDAPEAVALAALSGGSVGAALRLGAGDGLALYARIAGVLGAAGGVDRPGLIQLADALAPRGEADRLALAHRLIVILLARLARIAAGRAAPLGSEAAIAGRACGPGAAALWAGAAADTAARLAEARAVNLDPGQTIIDTFLGLEATLAAALRCGPRTPP